MANVGATVSPDRFAADGFDYQNFQEPQHLSIPFQVPERDSGAAVVTTKPVDDPVRYGVHLFPPATLRNFRVSDTKGFPMIHTNVASNSIGWQAYYGAIQVIAVGENGARLPRDLSDAAWTYDDRPMFNQVNNLFCDFAANPDVFDAPFNGGPQLDWVARMFVVYVLDAVVTKRVKPILGIEWGYWIDNSQPHVKETKQLDIQVWNEHLELLRSNFPGWTFDGP